VGKNFIHRHVFQGQNVDCACTVSRDLWAGVQNDHIFGIPEAILLIYYTSFMGLR